VRHRRRPSFWREVPILLGVALIVAIVVRAFVVQTFWIPSPSMEHTLNLNDRVLVNKLVYDFRQPRRGEIIVFHSPVSWRTDPNEKIFIKRVIGVGGDHVICCDGQNRILVNGHPLNETYLDKDGGPGQAASPRKFNITVPSGRLWVLGDNRYVSGDSEFRWGRTSNIYASTIPLSAVIGRAFVRFWPLNRMAGLPVPATFADIPPPAKPPGS
jgi:signal peptidase I